MNTLLQEFEAGRLPVPIPPDIRKTMYWELQLKILQSPPFTDTPTLISTHHCMQLLVSILRSTVPPEEQGGIPTDDNWIGSLLTVSPFVRILEYLSAEIGDGGNQRAQRKYFMQNFEDDLMRNARDERSSLVFMDASNGSQHQPIRDTWFDVAKHELVARHAVPHDIERILICDDIPIIFGCTHCRPSVDGWFA